MQQITHALVPGTFRPHHLWPYRCSASNEPSVPARYGRGGGILGKNGVGTVFTLDERVELARTALSDIPNVDVQPFCGLLVDFARQVGAGAVVKGLRAMTDFEYELQQADLNYRLDSELKSIFVMSSPQYGYLSSSVVRQIASFGGDVSEFVPVCVQRALKERFV